MYVKFFNWFECISPDKKGLCFVGLGKIGPENQYTAFIFPYKYSLSVDARGREILQHRTTCIFKPYWVKNSTDRKIIDQYLFELLIPDTKHYNEILKICQNESIRVYNNITLPFSSFLLKTKLDPSGEYYIPDEALQEVATALTKFQEYMLTISFEDIEVTLKQSDQLSHINYSILAFDIECYMESEQNMSDPSDPLGIISHISFDTRTSTGASQAYDFIFNLGNQMTPDTTIECFETKTKIFQSELEMIKEFINFIIEFCPSVILGYNLKFDIGFIHDRLEYFHSVNLFNSLTRFNFQKVTMKETINEIKNITEFLCSIPGLIVIDLYLYVMANEKLKNNGLDFVIQSIFNIAVNIYVIREQTTYLEFTCTEPLLNQAFRITNYIYIKELDQKYKICKRYNGTSLEICGCLPPSERYTISVCKDNVSLFEQYKTIMNLQGNSMRAREIMEEIAEYNVQDSRLCTLLYDHYFIAYGLVSGARLNKLPQHTMQQFRATTKILGIFQEVAFIQQIAIYDMSQPEFVKTKFRGGIVYEPNNEIATVCLHPVGVYDFEGLYPATIMAKNLSPDTFVAAYTFKTITDMPNIDIYKNPEKYTVILTRDADELLEPSFHILIFDKKTRGLYPLVLEYSTQLRAKYKQEMKAAIPYSRNYIQANKNQYDQKIINNTMYGLTAAAYAKIFSIYVAMATAACARAENVRLRKIFQDRPYITEDPIPLSATDGIIKLNLVYGDTDSQFLEFEPLNKRIFDIPELFNLGMRIEKYINEEILDGFKIEFEKILVALMLFSKKRYCAIGYTSPSICKDIDQGTTYVRRDACVMQKEAYSVCKRRLQQFILEKQESDVYLQNLLTDIRIIIERGFGIGPETSPHRTGLLSYIRRKNGIAEEVSVKSVAMFQKFSSYNGNYPTSHFLYQAIINYNNKSDDYRKLRKGSRFSYCLFASQNEQINFQRNIRPADYAEICEMVEIPKGRRLLFEYYLRATFAVVEPFFFLEGHLNDFKQLASSLEYRISRCVVN